MERQGTTVEYTEHKMFLDRKENETSSLTGPRPTWILALLWFINYLNKTEIHLHSLQVNNRPNDQDSSTEL